MAQLTVQQATVQGIDLVWSNAAAGGDTVEVDGDTLLFIKNTNGATRTVTQVRPGQEYGENNPDPDHVVPATTGFSVIQLQANFADPSDGLVHLTYSADAGLQVAAVRA